MPWSYPRNVPSVAKNKPARQQRACVKAANAALKAGKSDREAIFACIGAMRQAAKKEGNKMGITKERFDALSNEEKIALYYEHLGKETDEAKWSRAFINDLPDISFAVISPGGKKDETGRTVPRTLRHLPHHGKIQTHSHANVDMPHLKNAAARANQIPSSVRSRGKSHIRSHYRAKNMEIPDNIKEASQGPQPLMESTSTAVEILEDLGDDGVVARARFKISEVDRRNENGRVYPRTVWTEQVQRFNRGSVTGQDGHPPFFQTPKVTDAFLVFDKLEIVGDDVFGEADVADTEEGRKFVTIAKLKAKIATSTRGFGSVERSDKWKDGKPALIVQDDFRLVGVDVMFDGYQSVKGAKMKGLKTEAVHFIHEDYKDYEMDITYEWLEENNPDLIAEILHPFEHEVEELREQLETLTAERDEAIGQAESLAADLEEATTQLRDAAEHELELANQVDDATEQIQELSKKLEELEEDLQEAESLAQARSLIFEKAQGEQAAMLIVKDLLANCATPEAVKKRFRKSKQEAEAMLGSLPSVGGRAHYVQTEKDSDETPDDELTPEQRRYRAMTGLWTY